MPQPGAQSSARPASQTFYRALRETYGEISKPPAEIDCERPKGLLHRVLRAFAQDVADPVPEPLEGLRMDEQGNGSLPVPDSVPDGEAKELQLRWLCHGALLPVDLQFHGAFEELDRRRHHALGRSPGADEDHDVVGIPDEPVAPGLQEPVELVEVDVSQ